MRVRSALILVMALATGLAGGLPGVPGGTNGAAVSQTAAAQDDAHVADLLAAFQMPEVIAILREEGLAYAETLDADLLGGRGGPGWERATARIYDAARMEARFAEIFAAALPADEDLRAQALDFFASDRGQRLITLENEARRAMLDDDIDEAARDHAAARREADDPRIALIGRFIAVNDYVESNVAGGLNANFAFYLGLRDSGTAAFDLPESEMIANVWSQEQVIRDDTEEWLYAYLFMAYQPLPDDDLRAYIAFSETPAGQAVNRALFSAFDTLFNAISRSLGEEAGRVLSQRDL